MAGKRLSAFRALLTYFKWFLRKIAWQAILSCVYTSTRSQLTSEVLELIFMIRSLDITFATFARQTRRNMRQSFVIGDAMCLCVENMSYQPKPNGVCRSQQFTWYSGSGVPAPETSKVRRISRQDVFWSGYARDIRGPRVAAPFTFDVWKLSSIFLVSRLWSVVGGQLEFRRLWTLSTNNWPLSIFDKQKGDKTMFAFNRPKTHKPVSTWPFRFS